MSASESEVQKEVERRRVLLPIAIVLALLAAAAIVAVFWQPAPAPNRPLRNWRPTGHSPGRTRGSTTG